MVRASNVLTGKWLKTLDYSQDALISGYSAWSLLAALAIGATGTAADELATATGVNVDPTSAVRQLWSEIDERAGTGFGLWTRAGLPLHDSFTKQLPNLTTGEIPADMTILDNWVSESTNGLITEFPRVIDQETLLVLASVLAVDVDWVEPFEVSVTRWLGSDERFVSLGKTEPISDSAAVIEFGGCTISRYISRSTSEIDVHLVAGSAKDRPTEVLATAIRAISGDANIISANELGIGGSGGCLTVEECQGNDDYVYVTVPKFSLKGSHDLTDTPSLFGLETAMDGSREHFGRISSYPLAVQKVVQEVVAEFSAEGFRAGAMTVAAVLAGAGIPDGNCKTVSIIHDRPFGFLAVHRPTQLVLFAGWIATPNGFEADK